MPSALEGWRTHMSLAKERVRRRWHHAQVGCSDSSVLLPLLAREAKLARCREKRNRGTGSLPLLVVDVGANVGGFALQALSALGDLTVRFRHREFGDICRRPVHDLERSLDLVLIEGNPSTCDVLAERLRADVHHAPPDTLVPAAAQHRAPSGRVQRFDRVVDDASAVGRSSGQSTVVCAAAGEREGVAQWMAPKDGHGGAGLEANTGLVGTLHDPSIPVGLVSVQMRTVASVVHAFGNRTTQRPWPGQLHRLKRHPWCDALDDAYAPSARGREPFSVPAPPPPGPPGARRVFLLKVDAEGADASVLRGARPLLEAQVVDFLIFEYNSVWPHAEPLSRTVLPLLTLGYRCAHIGVGGMTPLSGGWWDWHWDLGTHKTWSNIWCALDRAAFVRIVRAYNVNGAFDVPHELLEWGLNEPVPRAPPAFVRRRPEILEQMRNLSIINAAALSHSGSAHGGPADQYSTAATNSSD